MWVAKKEYLVFLNKFKGYTLAAEYSHLLAS